MFYSVGKFSLKTSLTAFYFFETRVLQSSQLIVEKDYKVHHVSGFGMKKRNAVYLNPVWEHFAKG